jgi:N-acyl homoserine lactone hydrolase
VGVLCILPAVQTATSVRRLFVLLCGYEVLPKTISTRDRGRRFLLSEPISAYLLDTDSGWILIDTGFDPAHTRDSATMEQNFFRHGIYPPMVSPEHRLDRQLQEIGIGFKDIGQVIITHLHFDHTGYLKYFPHARVSIQRREHAFGFSGRTNLANLVADFDLPTVQWHLVDGDWDVVPGLTMIDTRGHTEGHQSAIVDLKNSGVIVLPFDAGDLQENFDDEVLPGEAVDDQAAIAAIRRLKDITASRNGKMILFHDPVAIQSTRLAPAFYD